jgi:hypothetical protein
VGLRDSTERGTHGARRPRPRGVDDMDVGMRGLDRQEPGRTPASAAIHDEVDGGNLRRAERRHPIAAAPWIIGVVLAREAQVPTPVVVHEHIDADVAATALEEPAKLRRKRASARIADDEDGRPVVERAPRQFHARALVGSASTRSSTQVVLREPADRDLLDSKHATRLDETHGLLDPNIRALTGTHRKRARARHEADVTRQRPVSTTSRGPEFRRVVVLAASDRDRAPSLPRGTGTSSNECR